MVHLGSFTTLSFREIVYYTTIILLTYRIQTLYRLSSTEAPPHFGDLLDLTTNLHTYFRTSSSYLHQRTQGSSHHFALAGHLDISQFVSIT